MHRGRAHAPYQGVECSTPFGDIDGCTRERLELLLVMLRAQRLSATLMDARASYSVAYSAGWVPVLNAFRRH